MVTCSQTCILWRVSSHVTSSPVWWCSDSVVRVLISLIHHQLLSNEDNKYLTITTLLTSSNFTYHNSLPMFWSHSEYTNVIVFCLQNCLSIFLALAFKSWLCCWSSACVDCEQWVRITGSGAQVPVHPVITDPDHMSWVSGSVSPMIIYRMAKIKSTVSP